MARDGVVKTTLARFSDWIDRWTARLASALIVLVVIVWFVSHFVEQLRSYVIGQSVYSVIAIVLLLEMFRIIEGLHNPEQSVLTFIDQDEAMNHLCDWVKINKPKRADLIEYSAYTINHLISQLGNCQCSIRLLIQDPDEAERISNDNADRIRTSLYNITHVLLPGYGGLTIRVYRKPASVRGRNLDGRVINIGWYTYHNDEFVVWGHNNAMITAFTHTDHGKNLEATFDRAFGYLWDDPTTVQVYPSPTGASGNSVDTRTGRTSLA
jgi:hypothetical protein